MKLKQQVLLGTLLFSLCTNAATTVSIDDKNIGKYFTLKNQELVAVDSRDGFKHLGIITLSNGLIKHKYAQYYQGVMVFNAVISSSEINGMQKAWQGELVMGIKDDVKKIVPTLSGDSALAMAKNKFAGTVTKNEKAALLIRVNEKNLAELIYLVSFNVEGLKVERPYFMINAHTGAIIQAWDGLTTEQKAQGPGGNERTGLYYYGTNFDFMRVTDDCKMSNNFVEAYNMNNQTTGGVLFQFLCPVNNYKTVNGAYSPLNDAYYFGSMVSQMYQNWYLLNPLSKKLKVFVHYGVNLETAHWDGEKMLFGDGALTMHPLTALDVMAHEVSHAVTEKNSGLIYFRQAGGINESFSDIAGEVAEAYMVRQVGKENDWLVGGTIMKEKNKAMRYFINPNLDGVSISHARDYYDNLDVHYSSGVFNKAFYSLATKKPSWDIRKAFSVFLAANQLYWQPESTFNHAACGVAKAAKDLSLPVNDVIASFKEVGVDANCFLAPSSGRE